MEFSQFCACGPSGYAALKQKVDACARLGRSYEFSSCTLPPGCAPERVQVGFWRNGEDYLLYFRPAVAYGGADPRLNEFFLRGAVQRYSGFQAMTDSLRKLDSAFTAFRPSLFQMLEEELQRRVLGQERAVEAAAFKLWGHVSKRAPQRPLSLIFYGPTGVGKSELGKAHPEVLKVFMSILDEGRCTARREDEHGERELDFRRCVFLFTTNTDLSGTKPPLGFAPAEGPVFAPSNLPAGANLAQRLYQEDEAARLALARSGVLREIAGRFSGLIGFRPLDRQARERVTAKQITALGREYGLEVVETAPAIARALTPGQAVSPRSTVPMLEGILGPVFQACSRQGAALRLEGTLENPYLVPAKENR